MDFLSAPSLLFSSTLTSISILILALLIRPGLAEDHAALAWWLGGDLGKIASRLPPLFYCAVVSSGCNAAAGQHHARILIPVCFCLTLGLAQQTIALARLCHVPLGPRRTIALLAGFPVTATLLVALLQWPVLIAVAADTQIAAQIGIIWRERSKSRALTIMTVADAMIVLLGAVFLVRTASGVPAPALPPLPPLAAQIPDFVASITSTFMMLTALGERERAYVRRMATIDQLTGTLNRRGFIPVLESAWRRTTRVRGPMSLALLDIDHFKHLNDTFGHDVGDAVLAEFAAALRTLCRDRDVVARWGGEEFLLLMPETPVHSAVAALRRIRAGLPGKLQGCAPCPVTFSAGVYECRDVSDADSIDALISRADHCLYQAKVHRDCIVSEPPERDPSDHRPLLAGVDR